MLVHCTTLHAGLLSAVAQQAGRGQVVGACPHSRAVMVGEAGVPRQGFLRVLRGGSSEKVAVPGGHSPAGFWCPHCSCHPRRVQPHQARCRQCCAAIPCPVCSLCDKLICEGEESGHRFQPQHALSAGDLLCAGLSAHLGWLLCPGRCQQQWPSTGVMPHALLKPAKHSPGETNLFGHRDVSLLDKASRSLLFWNHFIPNFLLPSFGCPPLSTAPFPTRIVVL